MPAKAGDLERVARALGFVKGRQKGVMRAGNTRTGGQRRFPFIQRWKSAAGCFTKFSSNSAFLKMNFISSGDNPFLAQALPWVAEELIPSR